MKKKNILMICLDGARVDMVNESNKLKAIFDKGLFFNQCIVSSPYTIASINSIMTGMYGYKNGVDAYNNMFKMKPNLKTLAEYLKSNNYYTHADVLGKSVVSERGFDNFTIHDENALTSEQLTDYHNEILERFKKEQQNFFIFFQYSKIHTQCVTNVAKKFDDLDMAYYSPKQKKINTDNFKASLDDAGHYSQKIIDKLEDLGILNETIVIFFSDHGTSLGEKFGEKMYGSFVYDYTIKTFFHFYTKELPNGLINNQIRAIDIMPTILDILKIPIDSQSLSIQGESLLDLISYNSKSPVSKFFSRPPKEKIAFVETGGLGGLWPSPDSPNVRCVRNSNYKLIHSLVPNKWEFYDLRTDPNELNNLILQKSKEIISLKKEMDKYI